MTSVYQHTQIGRAMIYPLAAIATVALILAIAAPALRVAVLPAIVLGATAFLMWKLTVRVDNAALRVWFGPGLIHKQVRLAEIESCEPIRTKWTAGWGIHYTRHGWLYNVRIGDAVAIRLRDGKRFCVGTDQPHELVDAIRRFASAR